MSTEVHPVSGGPYPVSAGSASALVPFTERAAVDPATGRLVMYLRIAQVDGDPAAPAPGVELATGPGPGIEIGTTPTAIYVDLASGRPVALATRTTEPEALTLVEFEILQPGRSSWHLSLHNRDSRNHRYVWVVADTDAGTRRPWLDLPRPELAFTATVGEAAPPQDLPIANHGTGPLTLDDPDGTDLGAGFTLLWVSPRPIRANRTATARIGFTASGSPGSAVVHYAFSADDTRAGAGAGHRNRLRLTGTVGRRRVSWGAGDLLALVHNRLCRLDRQTGELAEARTDPVPAAALAVSPLDGAAFLLVGNVQIVRVDRVTGAQTQLTHPLGSPRSLAVDRIGTLCVLGSDSQNPAVVRIDHPTGTVVSRVALPADPRAIAAEPTGDLVLVEFGYSNASIVARVAAATGQRTVLSFGGLLTGGEGRGGLVALTVTPDGGILVLRDGRLVQGGPSVRGIVARINASNGDQTGLVARDELADPIGLAVDVNGDLLVAARQGLFAITHDPARLPVEQTPRLLSATSGVTGLAVVPPLGPP